MALERSKSGAKHPSRAILGFAPQALLTAVLLLSPGISGAGPLSDRESWIFGRTCAHCHVRPGLGVPTVGNEAEWSQRRTKGINVLVRNVVLGVGSMPPLGTCSFCSESDLRAITAFMASLPVGDPNEGKAR